MKVFIMLNLFLEFGSENNSIRAIFFSKSPEGYKVIEDIIEFPIFKSVSSSDIYNHGQVIDKVESFGKHFFDRVTEFHDKPVSSKREIKKYAKEVYYRDLNKGF